MSTNKKPTTLRLPDELHEKLRYLAYIDRRSINMEIEFIISSYIAKFEEMNGSIIERMLTEEDLKKPFF